MFKLPDFQLLLMNNKYIYIILLSLILLFVYLKIIYRKMLKRLTVMLYFLKVNNILILVKTFKSIQLSLTYYNII